MLEFKGALTSLGFQVEALRLNPEEFANVRVPSVFLILPPDEHSGATSKQSPIGHYRVLYPIDEQSVEILDYPRDSVVVSTNYWIRHLRRMNAKNIPVLLCGKQDQSMEDMLLSSEPDR